MLQIKENKMKEKLENRIYNIAWLTNCIAESCWNLWLCDIYIENLWLCDIYIENLWLCDIYLKVRSSIWSSAF